MIIASIAILVLVVVNIFTMLLFFFKEERTGKHIQNLESRLSSIERTTRSNTETIDILIKTCTALNDKIESYQKDNHTIQDNLLEILKAHQLFIETVDKLTPSTSSSSTNSNYFSLNSKKVKKND